MFRPTVDENYYGGRPTVRGQPTLRILACLERSRTSLSAVDNFVSESGFVTRPMIPEAHMFADQFTPLRLRIDRPRGASMP